MVSLFGRLRYRVPRYDEQRSGDQHDPKPGVGQRYYSRSILATLSLLTSITA
jgi:hypothetical protein